MGDERKAHRSLPEGLAQPSNLLDTAPIVTSWQRWRAALPPSRERRCSRVCCGARKLADWTNGRLLDRLEPGPLIPRTHQATLRPHGRLSPTAFWRPGLVAQRFIAAA
jgi:hypothetical protein